MQFTLYNNSGAVCFFLCFRVQHLCVVLYVMAIFFEALLGGVPLTFQNEKQSPFKTRGGLFMFMTFAASTVRLLASVTLIFISYFLQSSMRDIYYTILRNIGCFSASLEYVWFVLVALLPNNLNWIAYSIICVVFLIGILVAYYFLLKYVCVHQPEGDKNNDFPIVYTVYFLLPLLMVLPLFVPSTLHVMRYTLVYGSLAMLVAYGSIGIAIILDLIK